MQIKITFRDNNVKTITIKDSKPDNVDVSNGMVSVLTVDNKALGYPLDTVREMEIDLND